MSNIIISSTFKRVAFTLVIVFLTTVVAIYLLNSFANENTAKALGIGIGLGAGVLAYMKFDTWFGSKE